MAGVVPGDVPELELHPFDEIDWRRWYQEG
jgi:hypothetical protein